MWFKRSFSVHGSLRAGAAWKLFVYTDFPPARGCTEARFPLITCRFATCAKSQKADFLSAAFPSRHRMRQPYPIPYTFYPNLVNSK